MKSTYNQAMVYVYQDEGGYSNDAGDPGGPTNYGITIHDARTYWKPDATAQDVRSMPKSVARDIYQKHYADPLHYDDLPAGVDYSVLDYGINSGISRSAKVLQHIVGVNQDGVIGPDTLAAVSSYNNPTRLVNQIYDERLAFLQGLSTWHIFGKGWASRCNRGRKNALALIKNPNPSPTSIKGKQIMFNVSNILLSFLDASHIGGWVRAAVASAGTYLATKYGMSYWNDPAVIGGIGAALSTIVVGLWSSLSKTVASTVKPV